MVAASVIPPHARRLPGLDALRGIAALCVVILHAHVLMPEFPDLMPRGYLAVDFFFVLSGYVMARTYEERMAGGLTSVRFLIARYRRLWPTMLVGALLFVPFLEEGAKDEDVSLLLPLLLNLFLIPSPLTKNLFPLNIPAWSILFELAANAMHGLFLRRFHTTGLIIFAALALGGLTLLARANGNLDIGSLHDQVLGGLLRVSFTYTLGILLWRTWGERALPGWLALAALVILPLCLAVPYGDLPTAWQFDLLFVALAAPVLLISGLALNRCAKLATLAGELSFPLYAVHFPVLYWCREFRIGAPLAILFCLVVAGLVAKALANKEQSRRSAPPTA